MWLARTPPELAVTVSWRELYERGAFAQRELGGDSRLRSAAREREMSLGLGQAPLEAQKRGPDLAARTHHYDTFGQRYVDAVSAIFGPTPTPTTRAMPRV